MRSLDLVGGKGLHLEKLISWGAPVPPFFVITTLEYSHFKKTGKIPDSVSNRIESFLEIHPVIALRSSMIAEDQFDASFAGMFETVLDVTKDNWRGSLLRIYESTHAPRVLEYLERKSINRELLMAVVAQAQVNVEKSGVLFTRSPVEPTSCIAIDAAFGMGEGVVSGLVAVDNYLYSRLGQLVSRRIESENPVLNESEIQQLISLGLSLEERLGLPTDIEWGFKDDRLYIFQIRPITRHFSKLGCYVDTNLSESYPGTVSPFTAGFVQVGYENCFREGACVLGISEEKLKMMKPHLANLVNCVDNHLYYNIEHYYATLRALPGGEKNIENWHKMIGGKMEGASIPFHATTSGPWDNIISALRLLKLAISHDRVFGQLLLDLNSLRNGILKNLERNNDPKFLSKYLSELIDRPLGFGLTIINDFYIMLGIGVLSKLLKKKGLREEKIIDLLKTEEGVDSLKPLEAFNELIKSLSPEFLNALEEANLGPGLRPYENFLKTHPHPAFEQFLEEYGDRSFEELKIESLPIRNDPSLFLSLIKWSSSNASSVTSARKEETSITYNFFESKLIAFTRKSIAAREATRLWRGKYYHLLRMTVLKLAEQLKHQDSSWSDFQIQDFFSISHFEWKKFGLNQLSVQDVQNLMIQRKDWQNKKQNYPERIIWSKEDKLPVFSQELSSHGLKGLGVSSGIKEGVALVLENPNDALTSELKDFILVTKNTDPAWVYIMSRSQGLISEKGSLLSHTAIIGRELAVPTIVGVKNATAIIQTGDRLRIDGSTGEIVVL